MYDQIAIFTELPRVEKLLGSEGEMVAPSGWPRSLGKVPGFPNRIRQEFGVGKPTVNRPVESIPTGPAGEGRILLLWPVDAKTDIWWRLWWVPGRHRWIAVAFFSDGSDGSLTIPTVIMKRSALEHRLPPGTR